MSATLNPIQTRYAGCHFRSRLEARWAVFFDHAGIEWQYEPQGFVTGSGRHYLPDFHLPQSGTWVEVKGHPSHISEDELYDIASSLPALPTIGEGSPGLLLLTDIPDASRGGNDFSWPLYDVDEHGMGAHPHGFGSWHKNNRLWFHCNSGYPEKDDLPTRSEGEYMPARIQRAYIAARSARFEHGQRG